MKEILEAYVTELDCVPFFLTDRQYRGQKVYWLIRPVRIDCFTDTLFPDARKLIWGEVPERLLFFFQTAQARARYMIVSLEVAENLLRRGMYGIRLIRIDGGDQNG